MTKKDYELIAKVLKKNMNGCYLSEAVESIIKDFATELSKRNPNFNKEKFYKACGFIDWWGE